MVVTSSSPAERNLKGREKIAGQERAGPPVVGLGQLFLLQHQHSHLQASGNGAPAYTGTELYYTGTVLYWGRSTQNFPGWTGTGITWGQMSLDYLTQMIKYTSHSIFHHSPHESPCSAI